MLRHDDRIKILSHFNLIVITSQAEILVLFSFPFLSERTGQPWNGIWGFFWGEPGGPRFLNRVFFFQLSIGSSPSPRRVIAFLSRLRSLSQSAKRKKKINIRRASSHVNAPRQSCYPARKDATFYFWLLIKKDFFVFSFILPQRKLFLQFAGDFSSRFLSLLTPQNSPFVGPVFLFG